MTTKITLNNIADTALATLTGPKVTTIVYPGTETATDITGGATINLTGGGFQSGCSVLVASTASSVVTFISSTQISFIAPALSAGTYVIYVINPDGGTAISIPGISYSGTPNWTTTAGSLGTAYETGAISSTLTAIGDAPIIYTLASGTLPVGSTLASNGTISGTAQATASAVTYSFTVTAKDAQNQTTNRAFSLTINPDVVTWSTPTDSATYNVDKDSAIANVTMSATSAAGGSITYTADTLPTGLSITGANIAGTPTVTANTTTVLTATATSTRAATRTINWVVSVASDTYFKNTTLLLSGNGTNNAQNNTFLDGSTNNFTITRNGNTTQGTFSPYGANWSNYFDGSSYSVSPDPGIGSGSFTTEFWVNFSSAPTNYTIFVVGTTANTQFFITTKVNGTGLRFGLSGVAEYAAGSFTWSVGTWYHVALVRNSGVIKFYVNGTNVTDGSPSDATSYSGVLRIAGGSAGVVNLTGYMSNLRIVKSAVYTANFTPSTTPLTPIANTALLTCQSNRFIDTSTNAFAITLSGTPSVSRFSPFSPGATYSTSTIGGSGYLSGASSTWLAVPINATFAFGTNNYTYEAWVYPTAFTNAYNTIFCNFRDDEGTKGWSLLITSTGLIHVNNQGTYNNSTNAISLNTWTHIAVCRVGNTVTRYINGVADPTTLTVTASITNVAAQGPTIGGSPEYPTTREWTGYISSARVISGTALYTSNFTPSTTPLTAITNTSLLLSYTNAGIIDNTMINNLETVGNAQISTAQSKFGGSSIYFDGTGDYLVCQDSPNQEFGAGNLTWEMWVNTASTTQYATLYSRTPASFQTGMWSLLMNYTSSTAGDLALFVADYSLSTGLMLTTGVNIRDSAWHHIAVVRNGSAWVLYVDGTSRATATWAGAMVDIAGSPYIGADQYYGRAFTGYIDDFRITKGYARYTANFTAPTTAFATK